MAILVLDDGSVIVSGGANRGSLWRLSAEGGPAGNPLTTLQYPVFDLARDKQGRIWAATGGGPLLQLDPQTLAVIGVFGDSLTQSVAVNPVTGEIYVSSGDGIEIFDPTTGKFRHYSDLRVGNMAFSPTGELWAAVWPQRGDVVRFDKKAKPQVMLRFSSPVDSLAFGRPGTKLEGLLFISNNAGPRRNAPTELVMVDLTTLRSVVIARGGTRGDIVRTTPRGQVLLSESNQIDVLSPVLAPRVIGTNPPDQALVALPLTSVSVTFDRDMLATSASDPNSVMNPANYRLIGESTGQATISSISYDPATRTAVLNFNTPAPDNFELRVLANVQSDEGLALGSVFSSHFTAVSDFSNIVRLDFFNSRSDRANGTVSYDVKVTNISTNDLRVPLILVLDPAKFFSGQPIGSLPGNNGLFLLDIGAALAGGVLKPGQSTTTRTVTIPNEGGLRASFGHGVYALPTANQAPVITSNPLTTATAGQPYAYQAAANDPDGTVVTYFLYASPDGMTVNPTSGLISWTPTNTSPEQASVILRVYDGRGGFASQEYTITVAGVNRAPTLAPVSTTVNGREGKPLEISLTATDADGDALVYWADNLPPGAVFDPASNALTWTPGFDAAGTYQDVRLFVSDGIHEVSRSFTLIIAPGNQAPALIRPADRTVREGDIVRFILQASDFEHDNLSFSSTLLPAGATLHPVTGVFEWTPGFTQAGVYDIPLTVNDGTNSTTVTARITVLNVNAAPVFEKLGTFQAFENQRVLFRAFAFDPDNPDFVPSEPGAPPPGPDAPPPSVTYTVTGLPTGATFDPQTLLFDWTPTFAQAGTYLVHITATDDGNGTGTPRSTSIDVPITIFNANRPPVVTAITNQSVDRGQTLVVNVSSTDPDGNPVTISATGLPRFATLVDKGDGTATITFTPGVDDRGNYPITVTATDNGDGGGAKAVLSGSTGFVLTVNSPNEAPKLAFIGNKVAVVGQPLAFVIRASDLDQDPLTFTTTTGLPAGATLTPLAVYGQAQFSWTPTAADAGTKTITFRVTDSGNGVPANALFAEQTIDIVVRAANSAPVLAPVANRQVAEGNLLQIQLQASDPDGDALTYSASNLPPGATFDAQTGLLKWTPNLFQAGLYSGIVFTVSDGNKSASETISISVDNTNQAPIVTPLVPQAGRENTPIQFTVTATDIDVETLALSASNLPAGAKFDAATGLFTWTPSFTQAGDYTVTFAAKDAAGATDSISVRVHVDNVNRAPSLSVSNHSVALGNTLAFNLNGTDLDAGAVLKYSAQGLPAGATLNADTGQFSWTPGPAQAGEYVVQFTVSDGEDSTTKPVILRAAVAPTPPSVVIELTPSFPVSPGTTVLIHPAATSLANITSLTMTVDGQPVALDAQGRAEVTAAASGRMTVTATATDADGLVGTTTTFIVIANANDVDAPVVSFAGGVDGSKLVATTDLRGTVADDTLASWRLEIAEPGSDQFEPIGSGNTVLANGVLATLDPRALMNGFYRLRLSATDVAGLSSFVEASIEVASATKTGQYLRSETDLTVTLDGVPLSLVRMYDSLARDRVGSFGPGWRLANRDVDLRTDVPPTGRENLAVFNPFRTGTRAQLTLPDGQRVGFTFTPIKRTSGSLVYYSPAWTADPGVNWSLASVDAKLMLAGSHYYDLRSGRAYNPASNEFGSPQYVLSAPDGTKYQIHGRDGVTALITPAGKKLIFSDSGVTAANGQALRFTYDSAGRIDSIIAPDSSQVIYRYDAAGNLILVRTLSAGQGTSYGYSPTDPHLLTIAAPTTGGGSFVVYQATPQVIPLTGNLGPAVGHLVNPVSQTLPAGQTQRFAFNVRKSELQSTPSGTIYLGVIVKAPAGSNLAPAVPSIPGIAPLIARSGQGQAFALFPITREGLHLLEIRGATAATAGAYDLQLFAAGDVNRDAKVDGTDAQQVATLIAQGGFSAASDANQDGVLNAGDSQLLGANFGYSANFAPVASNGQGLTHVDLSLAVPLKNLATDPEDDAVFFRITGASHGTAQLSGDGASVTFVPDPGYSGPASFTFVADDLYGASGPGTFSINVSNAPLQRLDVQFPQFLYLGDAFPLNVTGDFADQRGVSLPAGYFSLTSVNANVVRLAPRGGVLDARSTGFSLITLTARGLTRAAAINVFERPADNGPDSEGDSAEGLPPLPEINLFPSAVTLVAGGGTRQLLIKSPEGDDLTVPGAGTQYFVSNPNVVSVSATGLVTALAPGVSFITVINGGATATVSLLVKAPAANGSAVGSEGGVVGNADATITIAPGALTDDVNVTVNRLGLNQLPMALPGIFSGVGAFSLDLKGAQLAAPAELAIRPALPIAPGTPVYFMLATQLPENSGPRDLWLIVDTGVIDAQGMARIMSPPYPGIHVSGNYVIVESDSIKRINVNLDDNEVVIIAGAASYGVAAGATGQGVPVPGSGQPYTLIKRIYGPGGYTEDVTQVDPSSNLGVIDINLNPPPVPGATNTPSISGVSIDLSGASPVLTVSGANFSIPGAGGIVVPQVSIELKQMGSTTPLTIQVPGGNVVANSFTITLPNNVFLALAELTVVRTVSVAGIGPGGVGGTNSLTLKSQPFRFTQASSPVVVSASASAVEILGPQGGQRLAAIVLANNGQPERRGGVVVTADGTRAYVALKSGGVAVIDLLVRREMGRIEIVPGVAGLPVFGAMTTDPSGKFLYAASTAGVAVIDISGRTNLFNAFQQTIPFSLTDPITAVTSMAVSADGRRLYVTGVRTQLYRAGSVPGWYDAGREPGSIMVINVDPLDRPVAGEPADARGYRQQIAVIDAGAPVAAGAQADGIYPTGIVATLNPRRLMFTNMLDNTHGVMRLIIDDDSVASFAAHVESISTTFGNNNNIDLSIHNPSAVAVLPDLSYAFVLDYAQPAFPNKLDGPAQEVLDRTEWGSKIGVIKDPFGPNPTIVGVTTPVEFGFADRLALSSDGTLLYAGYRGVNAVLTIDVGQLKAATTASFAARQKTPLDKLDLDEDGKADFAITKPGVILPGVAGLATAGIPGGSSVIANTPEKRFGDVIELDLATLLGAPTGARFYVLTDTFLNGKIATVRYAGLTLADQRERVVQALDTLAFPGATVFETSGRLYLVPDVDPEQLRALHTGDRLAPSVIRGVVGWVSADGKTFRRGLIEVPVTDGSGADPGFTHITGLAVGDPEDNPANRPLDVYRVQQRLRYFGYPAWGGRLETPSANAINTGTGSITAGTSYPGRSAGQVEFEVNGRIKADVVVGGNNYDDPFVEAIKLFQAAIDTTGASAGKRGSPWEENFPAYAGKLENGVINAALLDWLNASNAPRWRKLDLQSPYFKFAGWFANKTGFTPLGDNEGWGTSWALELIDRAVSGQANRSGHRVVAVSNFYGDTIGAMFHATHKAGMDIDFMVDGDKNESWTGLKVIQTKSTFTSLTRISQLVNSTNANIKALAQAINASEEKKRQFYIRELSAITDQDVLDLITAIGAANLHRLHDDERRVVEDMVGFLDAADDMGLDITIVTTYDAIKRVVEEITGASLDTESAHENHFHVHIQNTFTPTVVPAAVPAAPPPAGASSGEVLPGGVRPVTPGGAAAGPGVVSSPEVLAPGSTPVSPQLPGPRGAPAGPLTNGNFAVGDPADAAFAWTARGNAIVNGTGQGVLGEGGTLFAGFSQTFTVPAGAAKLRFTIVGGNFVSNGDGPPDAFEAALLDADTLLPIRSISGGLLNTDALLNIQADGQGFFGPGVTVGGLAQSGGFISLDQPRVVEIDLSGVAPGTALTIYFDLLGFGGDASTVSIDDVQVIGVGAPPLTVSLDPASDSATKGDSLTNVNPIVIHGLTDPNQVVLLDTDGDEFDDGTATSDASGNVTFTGVTLVEGANTLRFRASNAAGNTDRELSITLDTIAPPLSLNLDAASDTAPAGDDKTTLPIVTLVGVTEAGLLVTLDQTGATTTAGADGKFAFANVALNVGANAFTIRTTDAAGNQSLLTRTFTRETVVVDTDPPVISASLQNDTGVSVTDRITSDATVRGTVVDASQIASFQAALDGGAFASVMGTLTGSNFTLSRAILEQLAGGPLTDGSHTLRLRATDVPGNASAVFQLDFVLDTRSPKYAPPAVINDGIVQRSGIFRIKLGFDDDLASSLDLTDLRLVRDGSFITPLAGATLTFDPPSRTALLNLKNVNLPDGEYDLRVLPGGVGDVAGNSLDVDGDGQGDGGTAKFASVGFFKLAGDVNADKVVDARDLLIARNTLDRTTGQAGFDPNGDLDDNQTVTAADLAVVTANLGHTLHPLSPPKLVIDETSLAPNDDSIHFGAVTLGGPTATPIDLVFRNAGQKALTIAALQIGGPDAASFAFQVVGDEPGNTGFVLGANMTKVVRIFLQPQRDGTLSATLRFWTNDPSALSGRSVALAAVVVQPGQALPSIPSPPPPAVVTANSGEALAPQTTPVTTPAKPRPRPMPKPVAKPALKSVQKPATATATAAATAPATAPAATALSTSARPAGPRPFVTRSRVKVASPAGDVLTVAPAPRPNAPRAPSAVVSVSPPVIQVAKPRIQRPRDLFSNDTLIND
jgi:YD repeat-containing protein